MGEDARPSNKTKFYDQANVLLVRSIRKECLDWFIIFSERQLRNIIKQYMEYYNNYRPHQGIKSIPDGRSPPQKTGKIKKKPLMFGLHHHYYRDAVDSRNFI